MKLLINKMNKGLFTVAILSLALVACGGGAVSGYGATSGTTPGTVALKLVATATPFGATYGSSQSVTLTANKADATFYYTINGSTPTTSSTLYSVPLNINSTTTLKVLAKGTDGALSAVITEVYTIDNTAPIVTLSPNSDPTVVQYVSLTSNEPGVIYYTTDGSTPSTASNIYTNPIATKISPTVIIKYLVFDVAGNSSTGTPTSYPVTSSAFTDIKIENTGGIQNNVPITFGHVFKVGELTTAKGTSVAGTGSLSGSIPLQVNVKAIHGDGSVRHAIISAVLPNLAANTTDAISFTNAAMGSTTAITPADFLAANPTFSARIDVTVGGVAYSANAVTLLAATTLTGGDTQWLSGPIVNEWIVSGPLLAVIGGAAHPHLAARFAIRSFAGSSKTKVDVTVENNKTFTAGSQNFTYDASIYVGGTLVDTITALEHFHHARWHKSFWWGTAPQVHLKHNIDYLIATKAVPNYDRSVVPAESALAALKANMEVVDTVTLKPLKIGPMKVGLVTQYMPTTGGRIDIGPMPGWYALYLLSMDKRAKDAMLQMADGSGSWSMHYRDDTSTDTALTPGVFNTLGLPVRIDKKGKDVNTVGTPPQPYRDISTHGNLSGTGPLPVPRCAGGSTTLCVTPLTHDSSHQPSLVYLPYLVTGDYFYLEELQFWAASNPLGTGAVYRDYEKGLLHFDQLRGQGWSLRTLGQAAYITPDSHPLKQYFNTQVGENLNYYIATYITGNHNQLGIIAAEGSGVEGLTGLATKPWMDDFFTWSIGYLAELDFANAQTFLQWKSKFTVGRMNDSGYSNTGYCWISGAVYYLVTGSGSSIYTSLGEAYMASVGNIVGKDGSKLRDKACASQAMSDWISQNDGGLIIGSTSLAGEMMGYSTGSTGYPSNMQPALAVASSSGIANGREAWVRFANRANKPNYTSGPQFAIVPRN